MTSYSMHKEDGAAYGAAAHVYRDGSPRCYLTLANSAGDGVTLHGLTIGELYGLSKAIGNAAQALDEEYADGPQVSEGCPAGTGNR